MGMGYGACTTHTISYENLKALCPAELATIEAVEGFESWGWLAEAISHEDPEIVRYNVPIEALTKAFNKATETEGQGLDLFITFYDKEVGDRYDEVDHLDGCMFEVSGVYKKTPAAERFKDKIEPANYVVFC